MESGVSSKGGGPTKQLGAYVGVLLMVSSALVAGLAVTTRAGELAPLVAVPPAMVGAGGGIGSLSPHPFATPSGCGGGCGASAGKVDFQSFGIPAPILKKHGWSVTFMAHSLGQREWEDVANITFSNVSNGSYAALITGPSGYHIECSAFSTTDTSNCGACGIARDPASCGACGLTVIVSGNTTIAVTFVKGKTVNLTIKDRTYRPGRPTYGDILAGVESNWTGQTIKYDNLTPGNYSYGVALPPAPAPAAGWGVYGTVGKTLLPRIGQEDVIKSETFDLFIQPDYNVTFVATGLPPGANWSVAVKGVCFNGDGIPDLACDFNGDGIPDVTLAMTNGTYVYHAAIVRFEGVDYRATVSVGKVAVAGEPTEQISLSFEEIK